MFTNHFKVKLENTLIIACHSWDLEGAKNVGLQNGYIKSYDVVYRTVEVFQIMKVTIF